MQRTICSRAKSRWIRGDRGKNILQGVADGTGYQYLTVSQSNPASGRYDISYRGQQMEWSPGQYLMYLDENGDPEQYYAQHPSTGDGTTTDEMKQIILGQPTQTMTETGLYVDPENDEYGNIVKKTYNNGQGTDYGIEEWVYDDQCRELAFRDKMGYVTRTWRDTNGNPTRVAWPDYCLKTGERNEQQNIGTATLLRSRRIYACQSHTVSRQTRSV